jgi:hypothetical protein
MSFGECKIEGFNIGKNCTPYKSIPKNKLKIQMDMVVTFKKCSYSNLWIIHVQSFTNLLKSMWKLLFNVPNVIF